MINLSSTPKRPPLRYFGGKWRIADWVLSHAPAHECYVEPFGGGANVLLKKHPSRVEVYNDIDQSVVTFFKVLRERAEELIRAIKLTPFSRQEVKNALEARRDGSWEGNELECARQFYVLSRQCQGGASRQDSSGWRFARTGKSDNDAVREWCKTDHMWVVAARLKNVQIECDEALAIFKRFDSRETLFYVDPPGQEMGRVGKFEVLPCPLCGKPCEQPLVRPGEPVKAGLTFVIGVGMLHPKCAEAYKSGTMQGRLFE